MAGHDFWTTGRRKACFLLLSVLLGLAFPAEWAGAEEGVLRIGYQRSSTLMALLKASGRLDQALVAKGVSLRWLEFTSGLPMLEALNLGNVDVTADVADTVPIFAQAAGAKLTYIAEEAVSPEAQAVLVPAHSPIKTLADLKGKKIAVTKAAGSHYLLIKALASAGLDFKAIQPVYLTPADGRAALASDKVDALVTWEPFVSSVARQTSARILADGTGLANYKRYYLTTPNYAEHHAPVLDALFAQLEETGRETKAHPQAAADILAKLWGIDAETVEQANSKRSYRVGVVTRDGLGEQQRIADAFFEAGLLPKRIDTQDVSIFTPQAP
ncbi:aliphatic sulfonate ABC transporter substrate-binding protein [Beijerinckia indica]|uniref:Putative aliphatic sulfonates-binding protein n=1 Tax=Beijerinckia indica subsp. indica (strain ATCC 9039 / DSM 1715 / NCIMB 8712) TaxID=395963 RepID=B2IBV6_BEII9|nr:aliphatic sulfonate ABC transporter substrate-binding protein [Beijerinckia indica]ACB93828.1 aliphatic sulfonates family ABC transporter, periplsmic ligand-binding protein [Beijerinckia indica subsp. indica ATCC 9039]